MKGVLAVLLIVVISSCSGEDREKRSAGYNDRGRNQGYGGESQQGYGGERQQGYGNSRSYGYRQESYYYKPKPAAKKCYQCAYSPPKTYYDKKVVVENYRYGNQYGEEKGYGQEQRGYGGGSSQGSHGGRQGGQQGGYSRKSYVPVPYTVQGGWDKCLGPFDHYQAKSYGVDVWDCHSNCYTRKDKNGNIYRGCYKGEYQVDPSRIGCQYQGDAMWCFCEGEKCNNGPAPH